MSKSSFGGESEISQITEDHEKGHEEIAAEIRSEILNRVSSRFGENPERGPDRERYFFHGPEHPRTVFMHAERIMGLAHVHGIEGADEEAMTGVEIGALFHDLVIRSRRITDPSSPRYGEIDRYRGWEELMPMSVKTILSNENPQRVTQGLRPLKGNEEESWDELQAILNEKDPDKKVYSERARELAQGGIAATYPDAPFPFPAFPEGTTIINGQDLKPYLFRL